MTTFTNECGIKATSDSRREKLANIKIGQIFVTQYQEQQHIYMRIAPDNLLDRLDDEDREEYTNKSKALCFVDLLTGVTDMIYLEELNLYGNRDLTKGQLFVYATCELCPKNQQI